MRLMRLLLTFLLSLSLYGCGPVDTVVDKYKEQKKKIDYKSSQEEKPLEVPPDLTSSTIQDSYQIPTDTNGATTLSAYNSTGGAGRAGVIRNVRVLPKVKDIELKQDGHQRWLVVKASPEQLWPKVREFWLKNGFLISVEDPRIGIIETDWAENRADIPDGPVRRFLGSALDALYSTGTRDKYRLRMERSSKSDTNDQTTELYLSHRRMEETITGASTKWQAQAAMPELEAEILMRLASFLGTKREQVEKQLLAGKGKGNKPLAKARLIKNKQSTMLLLNESFARGWRRTGHALDRIGFTVEDRNRSKGIYFVRYIDPLKDGEKKGFLDKLKLWDSSDDKDAGEYQIQVKAVKQGSTKVVVLTKDGQPEKSRTASRILKLLYEQLK